jgi:spermidine synthase
MDCIVNSEYMQSLNGSHFSEEASSADTITLYPIDQCYWAGRSPFQEIVIAQSPVYGKVLFLDREIQSAESDEAIYHEHLVHPVLNASRNISQKRVLVIGGGEGATVREILKWDSNNVASVSWVDLDGGLVELCRRHLSWADDSVYNNNRLQFYPENIWLWFRNHPNEQFDVIIIDLPDPDVISNRSPLLSAGAGNSFPPLYSREFFACIQNHLSERGVVATHTGPIAPTRLAGLRHIQHIMGNGTPYHTVIPSFQGEWGFWMSVQPVEGAIWPQGLRVMDDVTQKMAMTWPRYWFTAADYR